MEQQKSEIIIDAVITWVDGSDLEWQKKINEYREVKIDFNKKKESVRYNSIGEIDITIKSIIKYASFVKNIFLVTDNQTPKSFESLEKKAKENSINLILIDHKDIFKGFESYLPCFNSCSIGNMLFKIPNLAEHFIIFNDDTFLMRKTKPSDFFINGLPIVRGKWEKFHENRILRTIYHKTLIFLGIKKEIKTGGFKMFQQNSAKLAGMQKYVRRFHTPVSVRKSTLENFFRKTNILENNIKHRFRHKNQFIVSSLSEHLELKNNTCHYKSNKQLTYFRSYKRFFMVKLKLYWFKHNTNKLFMTFQSLEMANDKILKYILDWISTRMK